MKKICSVSGKEFTITDHDLKFYEKIGVDPPTLCPEERMRRRMGFRNERELYQGKCDGTGKKIVTLYSPEKKYTVYDQDYWWGDEWDPKDFGQEFDFSRPFFEQFNELMLKVPRLAIQNKEAQNAVYNNYSLRNKNCYLTFGMHENEDVMYSQYGMKNVSCVDCYRVGKCELCYECLECGECYGCQSCQNCNNCSNSAFLLDCVGCKNCFGCVNLRNKEYFFLNEKCTKEEYEKKLKDLKLGSFSKTKNFRGHFKKFCTKFPHKFMQGLQNESVTGDVINNCKEVYQSFDIQNCEDVCYGGENTNVKTGQDMTCMGYDASELCFETCGCAGLFDCRMCDSCWHNSNLDYCNMCFSSKNLFGCISMKHAEYCILNKQYSEEEYFDLRKKIIEKMKKDADWGEFFPIEISPFGYNETLAVGFFNLEREEALKRGYKWHEKDKRDYLPASLKSVPDEISEVNDSIIKELLACEACGKNYRIQPQELDFYRKMEIPIPHKCSDCRHWDRLKLLNPRVLWPRKCDKCGVGVETTFVPERVDEVFCEGCYLGVVE